MHPLLIALCLFTSLISSTPQHSPGDQYDLKTKEMAAALPTSEQPQVFDQSSDMTHVEPARGDTPARAPHGSGDDDEPMVYETPRDYATSARQERERLIAEGADPENVVLQSEVCTHVPRREDESPAEYAQRYVETMNGMIRRGVAILNDKTTADVVASGFGTADGRFFDLGPGSGATKGEFREFSRWFSEGWETEEVREVPEKWLRFEKPAGERAEL